jgi:hypothetical protein
MGSDEVYVPCGSELSQGDIVRALPWGAIDSPLTICRPSNAKARDGKARYGDASKVERAFKKTKDRREIVHARAGLGLGIVLWHSCEIADYVRRGEERKAVVGVAPIFSMVERLPEPHRKPVRGLQRSAMFPLPPLDVGGTSYGEAYVDFRLIWSVKQSLLTQRLASLSETYLQSMYNHLMLFLTRRRVQEAAEA